MAYGNHTRMTKAPFAFAGIVVIGLIVWFAMYSTKHGDSASGTDSSQQNTTENSPSGPHGESETTMGAHGRKNAGTRPSGSTILEEGEEGPQFPLVDEILSDEGLSNQETAERLMEIVSNKSLSVIEREEALAHGLNLDFPKFVGLVADPHIPQPLAQMVFDEMLNQNDHRDLQVRACISLVDHEDTAMREDAAEQLAFYIGLEERVDKPEELKQEAYAFLEEWAKRPPREVPEVDPDADIPETAPINPLERENEDDE